MKLISCHIDAFGKFRDVNFTFDEMLNVFCEKNGFGKTTLAEFIKAMFYSLPASSKKQNYKSERDFYRPFDYDGKYGGNLTFSCKRGCFTVVRQFGNSTTLDKFYLFDAKTNLVSDEFSSNLGEELFGVGKETFENSTFFGQNKLESGINDDIRANLSTGVLSGDDVDNFENAQLMIQKKVKEVRAEIKTLNIDETTEEIDRLKTKEEMLKNRIDRVEKEIENLTLTQEEMKKHKSTEKDEYALIFFNTKVSLETVIDANKQRINSKREQRDNLLKNSKIDKESYDFLKDNQSYINRGRFANRIMYILILVAVLGAVGILCGGSLKYTPLFYACSVISLVALVGVIVCIFISRNCALDVKRYNEIIKNFGLNSKSIKKEFEAMRKVESEVEFIDEEIINLTSEMDNKVVELTNLQKRFKNDFGCEISNYYLKKDTEVQKISGIDKKIIELSTDKKHYLEELESLQEKIFETTETLQTNNEKLLENQKKLDLLAKTADFLEKSRDAISNRFIEPVSHRFNKYYKQFIDDGDDIVIDTNLGMRFGSKFNEVSYLSAGLFDLVYICKRFALVDLIFKNEKPALILDDPFANFDDEKLKIARGLVNELKDDYQIIMFTCQKARA